MRATMVVALIIFIHVTASTTAATSAMNGIAVCFDT